MTAYTWTRVALVGSRELVAEGLQKALTTLPSVAVTRQVGSDTDVLVVVTGGLSRQQTVELLERQTCSLPEGGRLIVLGDDSLGDQVVGLPVVPVRVAESATIAEILDIIGEVVERRPSLAPDTKEAIPALTKRELEILRALAEARSRTEVAERFDISVATVSTHVRNAVRKLGATSEQEAIRLALPSTGSQSYEFPSVAPAARRQVGSALPGGFAAEAVEAILALRADLALEPVDPASIEPGRFDVVLVHNAFRSDVPSWRRLRSSANLLCLGDFPTSLSLAQALLAGARGALRWATTELELVSAIHSIAMGGVVVPRDDDQAVLTAITTASHESDELVLRLMSLTPAEKGVLGHVLNGLGDDEMAAIMYVSELTVKSHIGNLLKKLGVSSRDGAKQWCDRYEIGTRFLVPEP